MSPHISPAFDALPVEVLASILRRITSPEDLYATIRASPGALNAFRWFREDIILQVLQAHLPAEILVEYLGLLYAPKYEDFTYVTHLHESGPWDTPELSSTGYEEFRYGAWTDFVWGYFDQHFRNARLARTSGIQGYNIPQPSDKDQVSHLILLYGMLRRVIRDYQIFVRRNLAGCAPPVSSSCPAFRDQNACLPAWPPLSDKETHRLQRGFLRYELCTHLDNNRNLYSHMQWLLRDYTRWHRRTYLTSYLERWEEEEITCVQKYVHAQYQVLFRDVMAEFRTDVRRLSRKARHAPDDEVILAPDLFPGRSGRRYFQWAHDMEAFGLPLLQQLLQSDFESQRSFLKNTQLEHLPKSIAHLTGLLDRPVATEWFPRLHCQSLPTTDRATPTYISVTQDLAKWKGSDPHIPDADTAGQWEKQYVIIAEARLKEIGWVFWEDPTKLELFGLNDLDTGEEECRPDNWLSRIRHHRGAELRRFVSEDPNEQLTEQFMFVTKEDYEELSAKYAPTPATLEKDYAFLRRVSLISDELSKGPSSAFQDICSGKISS